MHEEERSDNQSVMCFRQKIGMRDRRENLLPTQGNPTDLRHLLP